MQIIDSPLDPRLADYSLLKSKEENTSVFVADNEKTALRLLNSNLKIKSVFCLPKYFEKHKKQIEVCLPNNNNCYVSEKKIFEDTIGFSIHQGFMAVGYQRWMDAIELTPPHILFNTIADSENIGSMIRTASAFGIRSLLFDDHCSSPFLRRSVRVSMGTIFETDVALLKNVEAYLRIQKQNGIPILALSLPRGDKVLLEKTISIYEIAKLEKFILIVGNEATGVEQALLELCDQILFIPMKNGIDSLNVSHALAVALSHILT